MQRPPTTAIRESSRQLQAAANHNLRRSHAKALHSAFEKHFWGWIVWPPRPHNVSLRLEKLFFGQTDQDAARLKVLFDFKCTLSATSRAWRALDFEPVDCDNTPKPRDDDDQSGDDQSTLTNCDDSRPRDNDSPVKNGKLETMLFSIRISRNLKENLGYVTNSMHLNLVPACLRLGIELKFLLR
jgi:hypothetical protein